MSEYMTGSDYDAILDELLDSNNPTTHFLNNYNSENENENGQNSDGALKHNLFNCSNLRNTREEEDSKSSYTNSISNTNKSNNIYNSNTINQTLQVHSNKITSSSQLVFKEPNEYYQKFIFNMYKSINKMPANSDDSNYLSNRNKYLRNDDLYTSLEASIISCIESKEEEEVLQLKDPLKLIRLATHCNKIQSRSLVIALLYQLSCNGSNNHQVLLFLQGGGLTVLSHWLTDAYTPVSEDTMSPKATSSKANKVNYSAPDINGLSVLKPALQAPSFTGPLLLPLLLLLQCIPFNFSLIKSTKVDRKIKKLRRAYEALLEEKSQFHVMSGGYDVSFLLREVKEIMRVWKDKFGAANSHDDDIVDPTSALMDKIELQLDKIDEFERKGEALPWLKQPPSIVSGADLTNKFGQGRTSSSSNGQVKSRKLLTPAQLEARKKSLQLKEAQDFKRQARLAKAERARQKIENASDFLGNTYTNQSDKTNSVLSTKIQREWKEIQVKRKRKKSEGNKGECNKKVKWALTLEQVHSYEINQSAAATVS